MRIALLVLIGVAPVAAQTPRPVSAIAGTVTDGTRPLAQATVEIFGTKLARVTGNNGGFRFDSLKPGPYWIHVRRIGFAPITLTTTLLADDTRDLQIELEAAPYRLPDIQVQGGMTQWRFNEFRWRQATAWGKFFTRDDIAQIRPYDVIALVQRGLPNRNRLDLEAINWVAPTFNTGSGSWATPAWQFTAPGYAPCPPAISFNGAAPWPGYSLRDVQLEGIEAVEVYNNRHVPIELQGPGGGGCGLVVLWLR